MLPKPEPEEKQNLHPRNLHRAQYNFEQLIQSCPGLAPFVSLNQYNNKSVDFSNPEAVKILNKALLQHFYKVKYWDIPVGYLCPPIPGRADYIHYMADVLAQTNNGIIPVGDKIRVLDIGTGANFVYPLIGSGVYGWQFVGTDIDPIAIRSAKTIIASNPHLAANSQCRLQNNAADIFTGVIKPGEVFDMVICNPPFHSSLSKAQTGTIKKWTNLGKAKDQKTVLNFGGQRAELWYPGGEVAFINRMVEQSASLPNTCCWFSTLVSKKETLAGIYSALKKFAAVNVQTIGMSQGQKSSRIIAWSFLTGPQLEAWRNKRWL